MIRENDLLEAIAECQGERNPNANTCIKLAAYYTILEHLKQDDSTEAVQAEYSYDPPKEDFPIYESESEFGQLFAKVNQHDAMRIVDELMETIRTIHPKLYEAVMREMTALE